MTTRKTRRAPKANAAAGCCRYVRVQLSLVFGGSARFAVLALGPVLKINGRSDLLPGGGRFRCPTRRSTGSSRSSSSAAR